MGNGQPNEKGSIPQLDSPGINQSRASKDFLIIETQRLKTQQQWNLFGPLFRFAIRQIPTVSHLMNMYREYKQLDVAIQQFQIHVYRVTEMKFYRNRSHSQFVMALETTQYMSMLLDKK